MLLSWLDQRRVRATADKARPKNHRSMARALVAEAEKFNLALQSVSAPGRLRVLAALNKPHGEITPESMVMVMVPRCLVHVAAAGRAGGRESWVIVWTPPASFASSVAAAEAMHDQLDDAAFTHAVRALRRHEFAAMGTLMEMGCTVTRFDADKHEASFDVIYTILSDGRIFTQAP